MTYLIGLTKKKKNRSFTPLEIRSYLFRNRKSEGAYVDSIRDFKSNSARFLTGFTPLEIKSYLFRNRRSEGAYVDSIRDFKSNSARFLTGFTLVELLIVAIIMSILTGLAIPYVRNSFLDIQSKDTCWYIMALMRYAQTRSIIERTRYKVNFDIVENRYWLSFQKEPDKTQDKYERIKTSIGRTYLLPEGMKIDSMTLGDSITFYSDGTSDDGKIYFSNKNQKKFMLEVSGVTGHIELKEISQ